STNTPFDSAQNLQNQKPYFTKLNRSNSLINPSIKFFNQDLNQQYQQDSSKFICKLQYPQYTVERKFIKTNTTGIKLYYTNFRPIAEKNSEAQILIIHGLYEHSGLYINVFKLLIFYLFYFNQSSLIILQNKVFKSIYMTKGDMDILQEFQEICPLKNFNKISLLYYKIQIKNFLYTYIAIVVVLLIYQVILL
ncbi:hypothetical protein IMG5_047030, partial [Ichthyophthirius multifiliis]